MSWHHGDDIYDDEDEDGSNERSLYSVLNVAKDASLEDIKKAYRNAAQVSLWTRGRPCFDPATTALPIHMMKVKVIDHQ